MDFNGIIAPVRRTLSGPGLCDFFFGMYLIQQTSPFSEKKKQFNTTCIYYQYVHIHFKTKSYKKENGNPG